MNNQITISTLIQPIQDAQTITLEQYQKKRERRRKLVADRMAKRFPLFAVEFMADEFPEYDYETFVQDVTRKRSKGKSFKSVKNPLKRQGRYPLYEAAMKNYWQTKEQKYLIEAQTLRNRLKLHFEVRLSLKKEYRYLIFPSTTAWRTVADLGKIKFSTWEELDEILAEKLKYIHYSQIK